MIVQDIFDKLSAWAIATAKLAASRSAWADGFVFLARVVKRFNEDQAAVVSGYIAYSAMLSLVPFLIFAVALAGFLVGDAEADAALRLLFDALPEHVARTLEPVLAEVLTARRGDVLTLSALGAIWAASNGIEALRIGLDKAYDVESPRGVAGNRLVAIGMVFGGYAVFLALGLLIVVAPIAFHLIEVFTGFEVPAAVGLVRYAIGVGILWVAVWGLHRVLPGRAMSGVRIWPGIAVSVVLWALVASGFSIYLAFAPDYSITYGALAGVIVTLLFFYFTGVAIMLGAEVNAVVNAEKL